MVPLVLRFKSFLFFASDFVFLCFLTDSCALRNLKNPSYKREKFANWLRLFDFVPAIDVIFFLEVDLVTIYRILG